MDSSTGTIDFVKMHGAGNDYVYVDYTRDLPADLATLARQISDRHFGIGADGLVVILKSDKADFKMRMFNADGSEAQMCGNATRCIGKYVADRGLTSKNCVTLETLAGIKVLSLFKGDDGLIEKVTVDMGAPILEPSEIPVIPSACENGYPSVIMEYDGKDYEAVAVSMGNPHAVIFIPHTPTDEDIHTIGKSFEKHSSWPEKTNVEFAHVTADGNVEMRVWERGTGETLACGTGSCATVVAGVLKGVLERKTDVKLLGGQLHIDWDEETGHVFMTGPAKFIAEGKFYIP